MPDTPESLRKRARELERAEKRRKKEARRRARAQKTAVDALVRIARDESNSDASVEAAKVLLCLGHGEA